MKVTLRDIAEQAGVSAATVSLVLNNKPSRISLETREKIIRAAQERNYIPSSVPAFQLRGKTGTIGFVFPNFSNPFYCSLACGIEHYAHQAGYAVLFGNSENSSQKCYESIELICQKCVDGMILVPSNDIAAIQNNKQILEYFSSSNIPMLLLDRAVKNIFCDFITADNKEGGYLAANHLLQLGHRKIGIFTGPEDLYTCRKRLDGYAKALAKYKIPLDEHLICTGDFSAESAEKGISHLLKQHITAVFCCSDNIAAGVYRFAHNHQLQIPQDLSVVGFDNLSFCEYLSPALTTVSQPTELMGKRACEKLIDKIEGKANDVPPQNYYFAPELVIRSSTSPLNLGI